MYVCSRNTAKTVHDSTKILGPPHSPFACGVQYQVSFKSGNEKIIKKSIPNSVKFWYDGMTIHKAQVQTMENVLIYLEKPVGRTMTADVNAQIFFKLKFDH